MQARDFVGLGRLVRSAFFDIQSEQLGFSRSVMDTRSVAETLAGPEGVWSDLVLCAFKHSRLLDQTRTNPPALEQLVRRGDVNTALAAIEAEPDELRRHLLRLATAVFLEEASYNNEAGRLRQQAYDGLHPWFDRFRDVMGVDPGNVLALARVLASPPPPSPVPAQPQRVSQQVGKVKARRFVPVVDRILTFFTAEDTLFERWFATGIIGLVSVVLVCTADWIVPSEQPLWALIRRGVRQADPPQLRGVLLLASLAIGSLPVLFTMLSRRGLVRIRRRSERVLAGLIVACAHISGRERKRIVLRAWQHQIVVRDVTGVALHAEALAVLLADELHSAHVRGEAADLIWEVIHLGAGTAAGDEASNAIALGMCHLAPADARAVLLTVDRLPHHRSAHRRLFNIVTTVAKRVSLPELLAKYISIDEKDLPLASRVPPADLARALLIALRPQIDGSKARSFGRDIVHDLQVFLWRITATPRVTPRPLEFLLWSFLYLPMLAAMALAIPLMVLYLLLAGCPMFLAARTRDPHRLLEATRHGRDPPADILQRAGDDPFFSAGALAADIRSVFLARRVLTRRITGPTDYAGCPAALIRRVFSSLSRGGMLKGRRDLVLTNMGEHPLLEATTLLPDRAYGKLNRILAPHEHAKQVANWLPLASVWRSLICVIAVASVGVLLWSLPLGDRGHHHGVPVLHLPVSIGLVACVYFSLTQHFMRPFRFRGLPLNPNRVSFQELPALHQCLFKGFLVALGFVLALIQARHMAARPIWDAWLLASWFGPLAVTALLAPEIISRWRGFGLLYPTPLRLWVYRSFFVAIFITACLAIGGVTRIFV